MTPPPPSENTTGIMMKNHFKLFSPRLRSRMTRAGLGLAACLAIWTSPGARSEEPGITNQVMPETVAHKDARMKWWSEARFGLFIHWGLYSVPAGEWNHETGYGEWFLEQTHMPVSQYEKFADQFNPTNFDARAWVRVAKAAGVKYIVITSKHHDGFGMYPSDLTDWCLRRTAFHRDPLKELAAACHAEGIRFCLYYSIMDWHSPDWGIRRDWNDVAEKSAPPDMDRYDAYMKGQLKELLTRYGPIGLLWFDGQWESPWTSARGIDLYNYVRSVQPSVIVNNRVGKPAASAAAAVGFEQPGEVGDYGTPEQSIPANGFGPGQYWESCMTMNDHWGFNKSDHNWKSTRTLVRNLIDCASKGGNFLMNVGPTSDGVIPGPSLERLAEIGDWMKVNGEAIYGTSASPFKQKWSWGRCTELVKGHKTVLYVHVFTWPADGHLLIPGLKNKIVRARILGDKAKARLATDYTADGVVLRVPTTAPNAISTTVVLEIKEPLKIDLVPEPKTTASNVFQNNAGEYGAQGAFDGDMGTRWATDDATKQAWVAIEFPKQRTVNSVHIAEAYAGRVRQFALEYFDGQQWQTIFNGTTIGDDFEKSFSPVTARQFRLNILDATVGPTINEIELTKK